MKTLQLRHRGGILVNSDVPPLLPCFSPPAVVASARCLQLGRAVICVDDGLPVPAVHAATGPRYRALHAVQRRRMPGSALRRNTTAPR